MMRSSHFLPKLEAKLLVEGCFKNSMAFQQTNITDYPAYGNKILKEKG